MGQTPHRIVRKLDSGERFIETPPEHWAARLHAWKRDQGQPCPLPVGHLMFRFPTEYGAVLEVKPQSLELFATPTPGVGSAMLEVAELRRGVRKWSDVT